MEIKYFNSNFDKITQNKDTDQSITNLIEKLPSLNIISDKNLLEETIKISKQFLPRLCGVFWYKSVGCLKINYVE